MATTILNETKLGFDYHGTVELDTDESCIIWTNGFPGTIGVLKNTGGGATNAFMVSAITDSMETIKADGSTEIDLAVDSYTTDQLVECKWGMSAYKIANGAGSDKIKVNWRIIRP